MRTAALYARVSSEHQREEQTIASQSAALKAHAASTGLEVPEGWMFEDDGYSGATLVRPALERLRDLVAQRLVDVVLCYAPDRLARRYAYQILLMEEFGRAGTEVQFVKGPKGDTAEDNLLLQFQGMIAEYERAQIAERTRRGKMHRARAGSVNVLTNAPYGYRYIPKGETGESRYEIAEEQAAVVRTIFRKYVEEQVALVPLAKWLNAQGIPTHRGNSRWRASRLWYMLKNPAYAGRAAFYKTRRVAEPPRLTRSNRGKTRRAWSSRWRSPEEWITIAVPAIVSDEMFERASHQCVLNQRIASRRAKTPALLQGLVACADCGYSRYRTPAGARRKGYYRCSGSDGYRHSDGPVCSSRPMRQDELETLVWHHVIQLMSNPELVRRELEQRLNTASDGNPAHSEKQRLEAEFRRVSGAIERLISAYQEELILHAELQQRMPDLRRRQESLRSRIEVLDKELNRQHTTLRLAESATSFLVRLQSSAGSTSITERQRIVRLLVKEVRVGNDSVVIRHSVPIPDRTDPNADSLLHSRRQDV